MASLIHDTSPIYYGIVCNKVIIRACIMDSAMPYFLVSEIHHEISRLLEVVKSHLFPQSIQLNREIGTGRGD